MAYSKLTWTNKPSETTPVSATRLGHMETQYDEAMSDVELSLLDPETDIGANAETRARAAILADLENPASEIAVQQAATIGAVIAPASVLPSLTAVTVWGESTSAADWPETHLADYTGLTINNRGQSGQGAADVLLRMGAFNPRVTVTGNEIPASGPVTITAIDPATGWRRLSGTGSYTFLGTLAGIPGTLTNAFASSANTFTFTRTASGSVTPVPAGTPFIIDPTIPRRNERAVLWTGRNNTEDLTAVDALVGIAGDALTSQARGVLVLGVLNGTNEPIGSAAYDRIAASTARRAATWGENFLDIRAGLLERGLQIAGITPTSGDLANIAAGVPPTSLMTDAIHPNDAGYEVVAYLVAEKMFELGWTNALDLPAVVPTEPSVLNLIDWQAAYWAGDPDWTPPTSGTAITTMRDGTGNGRDLGQIAAVPLPNYVSTVAALNNEPALQFTGTQRAFHDYVGEISQVWSVVVVCAPTTVNTALMVGTLNGNNGLGLGTYSTNWWLGVQTGLGVHNTALADPTTAGHLVVGVAEGASSKIELDGTLYNTGDAGAWGIDLFSVGGGSTAAGALAKSFSGHIAFVGIYAGDVTESPLWDDFKAEIATQYGLTIA